MKLEDNKIIIESECGTHLLRCEYCDEKFDISFYTYGNGQSKIWGRLKYAFQHLFTGQLFSDQMIFNEKESKKLVDFINYKLNEKT